MDQKRYHPNPQELPDNVSPSPPGPGLARKRNDEAAAICDADAGHFHESHTTSPGVNGQSLIVSEAQYSVNEGIMKD
jgi:hypothetical protein